MYVRACAVCVCVGEVDASSCSYHGNLIGANVLDVEIEGSHAFLAASQGLYKCSYSSGMLALLCACVSVCCMHALCVRL